MPYSLVLNLVPQETIPKSHLSGRHLHALFLELVRSQSPTLATTLHGQTTAKAFTLSPLQPSATQHIGTLQWTYRRAIPAGTPCWWRITLLDDTLFGQLAHLWLGLSSQQNWSLGGSPIQVVSVLGTPQSDQSWSNYTPYDQLYAQASDTNRKLHFTLCTPTTFRVSDYDCALPTRESVFKGLLKRWNCYSQIPFPNTLLEPVYPSFFNIRTELATDSRSKLIGCVGDITFQILGDVETETIKQLNTLTNYALYTGIGRKTPMGMGQVFPAKADVKPRRHKHLPKPRKSDRHANAS